MKEASGELSMTAIAVVAIAAVGVLFTTIIWPNIQGSLLASQRCSSAFDCQNASGGECSSADRTCKCQYYEKGGEPSGTGKRVTCENPSYVEGAAAGGAGGGAGGA